MSPQTRASPDTRPRLYTHLPCDSGQEMLPIVTVIYCHVIMLLCHVTTSCHHTHVHTHTHTLQWLVKLAIATREEMGDYIRAFSESQFSKDHTTPEVGT